MRSDRRLPGGPTQSACTQPTHRAKPEDLRDLVYELLAALDATARLAAGLTEDAGWEAHLAYLRDLQRVGRAILAHAAAEDRTAA